MSEFERSYGTGRAVVRLAAVAGWAVALVGLIVAVLAVVQLVGAQDRLGAAGPLAALSAGLGTALVGLVSVAAAQHMRATFDIADMTRELLAQARKGRAAGAPAMAASERPVLPSLTAGGGPAGRGEAAPKLSAKPRDAGAKVHPIFSARPPR